MFFRRSGVDSKSYNQGYNSGYDNGYNNGYENGYSSGYNDGCVSGEHDGFSRSLGGTDIAERTERALIGDSDIGFVTSSGKVIPRNDAFMLGFKTGIQLLKERTWG